MGMHAKLERHIGEIGDINSKLILLVGPGHIGKTQLLRQMAAKLNVGLEPERRLADTPNKKRVFSAGELLREIAGKEHTDDPLRVDDLPPHQQTRTTSEGASLQIHHTKIVPFFTEESPS
jgi:hypothetical protein